MQSPLSQDSPSNNIIVIISASLATALIIGCILVYIYRKRKRSLTGDLKQMPDANSNNRERWKDRSSVMTNGHDDLEIQAMEIVLRENEHNDTELVASVNQTDIGISTNTEHDEDLDIIASIHQTDIGNDTDAGDQLDVLPNDLNQDDDVIYTINGTTTGSVHDLVIFSITEWNLGSLFIDLSTKLAIFISIKLG